MLFGDDFPSLASKPADLSRGLSKTLLWNVRCQFPQRSAPSQCFGSRTAPMQHTSHSVSFSCSKCAQTHVKKKRFKGRPRKNQPTPNSVGANNFRPRNSKYCKGLSNRFSFIPSSVLPSCYKSRFIRNSVDQCRNPGTIKERSYSRGQPFRQGLLQSAVFSCFQERQDLQTWNRFELSKLICSQLLLPDGRPSLFKTPP